jgi:6-phosphogluconolactonase/glucosamine-6-phosphate isomerase/deaminase
MLKRALVLLIIVSFIGGPIRPAGAQDFFISSLPLPGTMVNLSPAFVPVLIKGLKVHPENPLLFDFILDTGTTGITSDDPSFKAESQRLIKYFLASLTIKEDDLWVNLSPYEKDRIIPNELGRTELGRDMLAQDYILKQLTASLIYPEKHLGREFWNRVYVKARQMFGTSDIPVNTFNKVWIVADKAKVLERNNAGYVVQAHLKVMLEEDYLALKRHSAGGQTLGRSAKTPSREVRSHSIASEIVREVILPELEKDANRGQNFAPLRQMFYSMILATWYKLALKDALLNQVYSNKGKTGGVLSDDPSVKEKIYRQYLKAYRKGVFNYIKEDMDEVSKQPVPRKYFSGGEVFGVLPKIIDRAQTPTPQDIAGMKVGNLAVATVMASKSDAAMNNRQDRLERFLLKAYEAWSDIENQTTLAISQPAARNAALAANRAGFAIPRGQDTPFFGIEADLKGRAYSEYFQQVQDIIAGVLGVKDELVRQRAERQARLPNAAFQEIYEFIHTSRAEFLPPGGQHMTLVSNVMKSWSEASAVRNDLQEDTREFGPFSMKVVGPRLMPNFGVTIQLTTSDYQPIVIKERGLRRARDRNPQQASMPPFFHSSVAYITNATQEQLTEIERRLAGLRQMGADVAIKVDELNVEMGSVGRKEIQDHGPVVILQPKRSEAVPDVVKTNLERQIQKMYGKGYSDPSVVLKLAGPIRRDIQPIFRDLRAALPPEILDMPDSVDALHWTIVSTMKGIPQSNHDAFGLPKSKVGAPYVGSLTEEARNAMFYVPGFRGHIVGKLFLTDNGVILWQINTNSPFADWMQNRARKAFGAGYDRPAIVHMTLGRIKRSGLTQEQIASTQRRINDVLQKYVTSKGSFAPQGEGDFKTVYVGQYDRTGWRPIVEREFRLADSAMVAPSSSIVPGSNVKVEQMTDVKSVNDHVARRMADAIKENNDKGRTTVFITPTGGTAEGIYAAFVRIAGQERIDLGRLVTFNMDEYYVGPQFQGEWATNPNSYRYFMEQHLFGPLRGLGLGWKDSNAHFLNGKAQDITAEVKRFEGEFQRMRDTAGIRLGLGGIGRDGHIAFNEPIITIDGLRASKLQKIRDFNEFWVNVDRKGWDAEIGNLLTQHWTLRKPLNFEAALRDEFVTKGKWTREFTVKNLLIKLRRQSVTIYLNDLRHADFDHLQKLAARIGAAVDNSVRLTAEFRDSKSIYGNRSRYVQLAVPTIVDNSRFFREVNDIPVSALTIGPATLKDAREIMIAATGEGKAEPVYAAAVEPQSPEVSASSLQGHANVSFVIDGNAAKIFNEGRGFDSAMSVQQQKEEAMLGAQFALDRFFTETDGGLYKLVEKAAPGFIAAREQVVKETGDNEVLGLLQGILNRQWLEENSAWATARAGSNMQDLRNLAVALLVFYGDKHPEEFAALLKQLAVDYMSVPASGQTASAVEGSLSQLVASQFNGLSGITAPEKYPEVTRRLVHDGDIQKIYEDRYKSSQRREGFLSSETESDRITTFIYALYQLTPENERPGTMRHWAQFMVNAVLDNEPVDDSGQTRGARFVYKLNASEFSRDQHLWSHLAALAPEVFLNEEFWLRMLTPQKEKWDQGDAPAFWVLAQYAGLLDDQHKTLPPKIAGRLAEFVRQNPDKVQSLLGWFQTVRWPRPGGGQDAVQAFLDRYRDSAMLSSAFTGLEGVDFKAFFVKQARQKITGFYKDTNSGLYKLIAQDVPGFMLKREQVISGTGTEEARGLLRTILAPEWLAQGLNKAAKSDLDHMFDDLVVPLLVLYGDQRPAEFSAAVKRMLVEYMSVQRMLASTLAVHGTPELWGPDQFYKFMSYGQSVYPLVISRLVRDVDIQSMIQTRFQLAQSEKDVIREWQNMTIFLEALYESTPEKERPAVLKRSIQLVIQAVSNDRLTERSLKGAGYQLNAAEFASHRLWSRLIALEPQAFWNEDFWSKLLNPYFQRNSWDQGYAPAILVLAQYDRMLRSRGLFLPVKIVARVAELAGHYPLKVKGLLDWYGTSRWSKGAPEQILEFLNQNGGLVMKAAVQSSVVAASLQLGTKADNAQAAKAPGGIDLNAANMALAISKDGQGVSVKFDPVLAAEFRRGDFSGIIPVILRITPIASALPVMGLETSPALNQDLYAPAH